MPNFENKLIEVCTECGCACCYQGEFMCGESRGAGTELKTVAELRKNLYHEHEGYWSDARLTLVYGEPAPHGYKEETHRRQRRPPIGGNGGMMKIYTVNYGRIEAGKLVKETPKAFKVKYHCGCDYVRTRFKKRQYACEIGLETFSTEMSFASKAAAIRQAKIQCANYQDWVMEHYNKVKKLKKELCK